MPRNGVPVRVFQPNIFERVSTIAELRDAVSEISGIFGKSTYSTILDAFFERDFVLEVVLSELTGTIPLNQWITSDFPTQPNILFSSFSWRLLWRLSSTFCFRDILNPKSRIMDVVIRYDRMVNAAPDILKSLLDSTFGEGPFLGRSSTWAGRSSDPAAADQRGSERRRMNPVLLNDFSIRTPTNAHEKTKAIQSVFDVLKSALQFYLELLSVPNVSHALREAFLAQTPPPPPPSDVLPIHETTGPASSEAAPDYPQVEHLEASQPFHDIEGFGKWKILLSSRAEADLRESSRKNRGSFKIIVKKIKELSHGNFSPNNQKRLNGTKTNVPIFAARVAPDTRLIYHIHSIPDEGNQGEQQAIRVFGIYTHAHMDDRLWDSIGHQLGRKGKEYIRRCTSRTPGHGEHFFLPTPFLGFAEDDAEPTDYLDLPPDDMDKVHSLLVLEKYMSFSRELLYTMLANLNSVMFPFNMSPQEQEIVDFPYSCFVIGRSGTGKTTTMLYRMLRIEGMFQLNSDYMRKPRQIFVTKSPVLALRVQDHSQKLVESLTIASLSPQQLMDRAATIETKPMNQDLVNLNDEQRRRSDLPRKFSELQDSNFPLFITFDHLCDMIEGDYEPPEAGGTSGRSLRNNVSFQAFQRIYWSHFPQSLIKGLDPAMVFSEMLGIIKGSEEALSMPNGYLDRTTYENISERRHPTFAHQRGRIYNIFEMYQAKKHQRGEWDVADRTHVILSKMADSEQDVVWQKVDQLCVDEAQDNLLIDALVLRSLCHNPDGLFWAGDTAQTISAGSSFRFNDLKSFLYRIEERRAASQPKAVLASHPPKTFQLTTNYRSHAGILNCAHSVIELITMFWPDSIDTLAAEKGIVEGLKPIFLWGHEEMHYTQFLFGTSEDLIEFGANQCVIVRNEDARQKLVDRVGNAALIMTVYESKGLEFNDVLLYNFFEDSSADHSQWRIVLSAIMSEKTTSIKTRDVPQFDRIHHSSICNELKCLYVAITRARKKLWIVDHSDRAEPMKLYWSSREQIRDYTPGMELPRFNVASSQEEWAAKGKELFDGQHYLQAKQCYERAGLSLKAAISNAYLLREEARMTPPEDLHAIKNAPYNPFGKAAECFLSCARDASENQTLYRRLAAECFEDGGDLPNASKTYLDAQDYDRGAKLLCKLRRFDRAVEVMKANEKRMSREVKRTIKRAALSHYLSGKELSKAQQLFSPEDDVVEYLKAPELEEHGLDVQVAAMLQYLGKFFEAGELHLRKRRPMEAIPLFLKGPERDESTRQAANAILKELWRHISFNVFSSQPVSVAKLISWSANLNLTVLQPNEQDEIEMFQAVVAWNKDKIIELARIFLSRDNAAAAALCLNRYVTEVWNFKPQSIEGVAKYLELFLAYTRLLPKLASPASRSMFTSAMRLFGVQRLSAGTSNETFTIRPGTFLHSFCERKKPGTLTNALSIVVLRQTLREAVHDYLWHSVMKENTRCGKLPQMTCCLDLALPGRPKTSRRAREPVTFHSYNLRIRINLQHILIIETLRTVGNWSTLGTIRRRRLNKFYEAMNPAFYSLGGPFYLNTDLIPEYQDGVQVVKSWTQDLVDILHPYQRSEFLTHLIRGCFLESTFDKEGNSSYWSRALPLFMSVSRVLRPPHGEHVKEENLVYSLRGRGKDSITCGVLSLSHIITARLPIDIGIFCDVLEFLFGSIIIASGWKEKRWHEVKLPWSWIARFMPNSMDKMAELAEKSIDIPLLLRLIIELQQVLEFISNSSSVRTGFLLLESKDLSRAVSFKIRGLFITRICRALTLLGFNVFHDRLRSTTWTTIKSLNRSQRKFDSLSQPYVDAKVPKDLVDELRKNSGGNLPDELLQFHDLRRELTPEPSRGINFLSYENEEEIIPLFITLSKSAACGTNANSVKAHAGLEIEQFATSGRPTQNRFFSGPLGRSHNSGLKLKKQISSRRPPHVSIGLKIIHAAYVRREGLSTNREKTDDLDLVLSKSGNARRALSRLYHKIFDHRPADRYERNVARLSGSFQEAIKLLQVLPQACLANNTCRELEKALRGVIRIQRRVKRVVTTEAFAEPATELEDQSATQPKEGSEKVDESKSCGENGGDVEELLT